MSNAEVFPLSSKGGHLAALSPRGEGRGGIEAQSSYLAYQALHHRCAPYRLLWEVFIATDDRLSARWSRARWGESHLVNGYQTVAQIVADILTDCTGIEGMRWMTFYGLDGLCDPVGKHFMHDARPWCWMCYQEARKLGTPAWDPLYTYPETTKVCVRHGVPLQFLCPKCASPQRFVPKIPFLDYCENCCADLAVMTAAPLAEEELSKQLWMARAAQDLLAEMHEGGIELSVVNFSENLSILKALYFPRVRLSRGLGIAESNEKNWLKRGAKPSWASLLDLAYRLDVPPAALGAPGLVIAHPDRWRTVPTLVLDKPHIRPNKQTLDAIRMELARSLKATHRTDVQSATAIAKRFGVRPGVLSRHFPEQYGLLAARRKELQQQDGERAEVLKQSRLAAATAELSARHKRVTARNLVKTGKVRLSDVL